MTTSCVPRVSICVPNLNTRPFLRERFDTILAQTFRDWELLIYDSYSDDGAWDDICAVAANDPRVRAWQGPRNGTPGSWTPCVAEARGEYVYVATSDDTMPPDCLEKLVAALDAHPECDLAHCALRAVDEAGREIDDTCDWWRHHSPFALSSGRLVNRPHIRVAPFDGVLHLLGGSVYISITQLLIRRSLFDRIGYFQPTWGSVGDFNWAMRAGLVAHTVHVPDTWGGWRVHRAQATAAVAFGDGRHAQQVERMIDDAVAACEPMLPAPLREHLRTRWVPHARELRAFVREVASRQDRPFLARASFLAQRLLQGSVPARDYLASRLPARSPTDWVRDRLDRAGFSPPLVATNRRPPAPSGAAPALHP